MKRLRIDLKERSLHEGKRPGGELADEALIVPSAKRVLPTSPDTLPFEPDEHRHMHAFESKNEREPLQINRTAASSVLLTGFDGTVQRHRSEQGTEGSLPGNLDKSRTLKKLHQLSGHVVPGVTETIQKLDGNKQRPH